MEVPSLYFLDSPRYDDPSISISTLDDSRITLLISEGAANFLQYPATNKEREGRGEIFKKIREDYKFYGDIISLKLSLVSLDSSVTSRRMAPTKAVKCFKNVKVLNNFVLCVDKLCALEGGGVIIEAARKYWSVTQRDFIEELREDIETANRYIDSMGYVNMRLDNTGFSLIKDENNDNFVDKLLAISDELKIAPPKASRMTLKLDVATAEALERLFPKIFHYLGKLMEKYSSLPTKELFSNKKEIDFYLELNELVKRGEANNIPFCYPVNSATKKFVAREAYDISLLYKKTETIVPNDITFEGDCGFCFLTGANGGGKTTYLRTVAINLVLSLCGAPVFARSAEIYSFDRVITHFPADERFWDTGRLVEEQKRISEMLEESTKDSFLMFNETFSGTDDVKGCELTLQTARSIKKMGAFGLFVTHFHEVSKEGFTMLGTLVDEKDDNKRLYKIVMKNGGINSSFANDILKKYNLDKDSIDRRIAEYKGGMGA
ncbi:MAG: hypothetical protein E7675_07800 [Ruminococcaceae bacterium]|nr:hypothetical protein [Oscillospiraceae bacterium]